MWSILTLVLWALIAVALLLHSAMTPRRFRCALAAAQALDVLARPRARTPTGIYRATRGAPDDRPPARPVRVPFTSADPLAKHRAITGINAHVRWYQRVASLVGIVALVAFMGLLLAVSVVVLFFGARIVLELIVG